MAHGLNNCYHSNTSSSALRTLNSDQNFLPVYDLDEEQGRLGQIAPKEIPPAEPGQGGAKLTEIKRPASENEVPDKQYWSERHLPRMNDVSKMLVKSGSLPISTLDDYSDVSSCSETDFQNHLSSYQNSVYPISKDTEKERSELRYMSHDDTLGKGATEDQEENSVNDGDTSEEVAKETENTMPGRDQDAVEKDLPETEEDNRKTLEKGATSDQAWTSVKDRDASEVVVANAQDAIERWAPREAPETVKDHSVLEDQEGHRVAEEHDTMETGAPEPKDDQSMAKTDDTLDMEATEAQKENSIGMEKETIENKEDRRVGEDQDTSEGVVKQTENIATGRDHNAMERRSPETMHENSVVEDQNTLEGGAKKTKNIATGEEHNAMKERAPETEEENSVGKHQDTSEDVAKETEDHMVGEGHDIKEIEGPETKEKHHVDKPDETPDMEATEPQEENAVGSRPQTEHQSNRMDAVMEEIASLTLEKETLTNNSADPSAEISDHAGTVSNCDPQPSLNNTTQKVPKNNVHIVQVDVHHSFERSDPKQQDKTVDLLEVEHGSFDFLHSCFGLNSLNQISQEPEDLSCPPVSVGMALLTEDRDLGFKDAAKTKIFSRTVVPASELTRKLHPVVVVQTTDRTTQEGHGYHCALCPETFRDVDEVIEHQHCTHTQPFHRVQHCLSCRAYYSCKSSAERHICGQTTPRVKASGPRQGNLACQYCRKPFINVVAHYRHEQQHREVTPHRCPCCGLYYISEDKLKSHKRKVYCMPMILDPQEHPSDQYQRIPGLHPEDEGDASPGLHGCFVKLIDINNSDQTSAQCPVCGKGFPVQAELEAHMSLHSNLKPFRCNLCLRSFKYSWNLEDHKREKCSGERKDKPFHSKCPLCLLPFINPYSVMRHLKKLCVKEYFKKSKARTNEDKPRHKCPLCPAIFTMSSNCKRHLSNVCLRQFKGNLLGKEMSPFRFSCTECTSMFAHPSGLYRHMKKHRRALDPIPVLIPATNHISPNDAEEPLSKKPEIKSSFTCQFCDKCFSNIHSLKEHLLVHTGDKPFSCLECGKSFPKRKYLLAHRNIHSPQIQCTVCKKILPTVGDLLKHRKSHVKKGLLQCPDCPMQFKFPVFFLRHIKIHAQKKPKPKPLAKSFTQEDADKKQEPLPKELHMETDTQEQHRRTSPEDMLNYLPLEQVDDLRCGICHREFPTYTAFGKHCLSHLPPVYDNKCTICVGRWFTSRIALIRHMRLHTGEKPFKCLKCGMRFRRKEALGLHQTKCQVQQVPSKEVPKVEPKIENKDKKEKSNVWSIKCLYCPRMFPQKGSALMHERAHEAGSLIQCAKCQTFYKKSLISGHRANCTPGKFAFGGISRLNAEPSNQGENQSSNSKIKHTSHKTKVQQSSSSSFKEKLKVHCPHCPQQFKFRSYLLRHLRSHSLNKQSSGEENTKPTDITDSSISESKTKVLRCNICTKTFTKASSLRQHILIHTDAKPYRCETCESSFSRSDNLKVHQVRCRDRKKKLQVRVEKISLDCIGTGWQTVEPASSPPPPPPQHELECKTCLMKFSNHNQLSRHTAMMHSTISRFFCKTCDKKFSSWSTLKRHNLYVKCKVSFRQNDQSTSSPRSPTAQPTRTQTPPMQLHTEEKPFVCTKCDERFIRKDYLQRHISKCSGTSERSTVHCEHCGKTFTQEALQKHQKTCGTDSPRRLRGSGGPANDSSLTSSLDFKTEPKTKERRAAVISKSQLVVERPFECQYCKMRFISKCGMVIHVRTHSKKYSMRCKKCKQGFCNKVLYKKHVRNCKGLSAVVQPKEESEKMSSEKVIVFNKGSNTTGTGVLQTKFSCKDQTQIEAKVQPVVHKYQCSECDQSFTDGLRLISHLEAHGREDQLSRSDPKMHSCNHCDETFKNAGLLQRHLKRQHQETVINMCPICNKKFRYPSDLEIHKSLHDPNRPFACSSCKLRYWTDNALSVHQRNAHLTKEPPKTSESVSPEAAPGPTKSFACSLCDRTYSSRSTYLKHYRLKHKNTPMTSNELQNKSEEQQTRKSESDGGDGAQEDLSDNDSDSAPYFPCHVCGKTFRTSESLEDHQKCHLGEKPHECEECGKCFFQLNNLQQHQRSHKSEFQCQKCGKGFVSGFALRKHKNTHLKTKSHRCTKCQLCFTKSSQLAEHLLTHQEENFPCDVCQKTFSCKESREEHRKSHADMEEELPPLIPPTKQTPVTSAPQVPRQIMHQCEACKMRFQDLEQLAEHVCNLTKDRPYPCTDCDQHFVHGSHLKKHQLTHQLSGTHSFQCNTCHLKFSHRTHFLSHLQTHGHKEPPELPLDNQTKLPNAAQPYQAKIYQCPICPESFAQALELASHLSVHAYMCNVCSKTFPTPQQLEAHEQSHLSVATQYECTECGESFLGSEAFRQHRWAHQRRSVTESSQSPPHKKRALETSSQVINIVEEDEEVDVGEDFLHCSICNKRFSSSITLQEHQRQHHDNRPFKCPVCAKGFTKKKYLTQHQQSHNSRLYPCGLCSNTYRTEMALATHQKSNHSKKHPCSLCNRIFHTSQDLAQHKASHSQLQSSSAQAEVKHACDLCYKSFKELHQLQKHQETHVAQVVYECTECDKTFAYFNLLEEHQKTHLVSLTSLQLETTPIFVIEDSVFE